MGQSQSLEQNRQRFRNSLTAEQIGILENKEMTQNQKKKAFKGSLNDEQKAMLRENNQLNQQQKNEFRHSTAAEEQNKQMMQYRGENSDNSAGGNGNGQR